MAIADLPGWMLATEDEELARALEAQGAHLVRRARVLRASTGGDDPGLRVTPLRSASSSDLLPSWKRAYASPHPDHESGDDARLLRDCLEVVFDEEFLGPLHESSAVVRDDAGAVIAAIVIKLRADDPPGPWISDVWVDPAAQGRGIGSALIRRALASLGTSGHASLGLAVTVGNPAEECYRALGFVVEHEAWRLLLPST